ncbi:MAG: bifunctional 2-polyprenyl-6-hydroxyphenol methylase/3-demethylubiquinol 3-O-methyltransferase UbiG [Proteobacteria bacterium]|nr:bifunctional 2-polyprenyl-6-hydroxyphenol methylase/3-demethylubiquinol 3-O-methyltransferase UbiG [Pseudomonadota bacterium]
MTDKRHDDQSADPAGGTVDPEEIARFSALAAEWWNPAGKFKPLHRLNPVRLAYIRDHLCDRFDRDPRSLRSLDGLRILDIGCGGGLVAEPLGRMGADVTGIDTSPENIATASVHAKEGGLSIDYRATTAEEISAAGGQFDAVIALEIVEHVARVPLFLASCAALIRPGGALIMSTLNRTAKSYLMAIVGAEYILRWLPRGTHQWEKFLRPSELTGGVETSGLSVTDLTGATYNPLNDEWRLSRDMAVNYMLYAEKDAG